MPNVGGVARYPQMKNLHGPASLRRRLGELGLSLADAVADDVTPGPDGALAQPVTVGDRQVGNRFSVLPMEGWDATTDGAPTELLRRRWHRIATGGAKLLWMEATAVRPDARANPRQLVLGPDTVEPIARLGAECRRLHHDACGRSDDLLLGVQLTHSGRWSRPDGPPAPAIVRRHPLLDGRVGATDDQVLDDDALDALVDDYVRAAALAAQAGFDFVDIKHCHGYLLHELLSATDRSGRYGGSLDNRLAFLRRVLDGVGVEAPKLLTAVRLSAVDVAPHTAGPDGTGIPAMDPAAHGGFGLGADGVSVDLAEPIAMLERCRDWGVTLAGITVGSPYWCPHAQRPAYFPPSDGYQPPADPLVEVARMIHIAATLHRAVPDLVMVGTGYSYLQDHLAHVAEGVVERGDIDIVGIGRMALSYPHLPADVLAGRPLDRRLVCRTFSDCTTAPRNGMVSGCYPLDEHYKAMPERVELAAVKKAQRARARG